MDTKRRVFLSKFLSRHLRHAPDELRLTLQPGGWVSIAELIAAATRNGVVFNLDELREVVVTSDKKRFAMDDSGTRIRANQGHSVEVDLQLCPAVPPTQLFHGTAERNVDAILADGLRKMARHHVHLSTDIATATKVGQRHGKPIILIVDTARMRVDGHKFFISANGVWLVEWVPPQYLRVLYQE